MNLRRVEVAWRILWMRAICRTLPARTVHVPPIWDQHDLRVLYLRYERIGDVIMATAPIRVLAQRFPRFTIDALVTPGTAPVLDGNPYVHDILRLDRRSSRSYLDVMRVVHERGYDMVVDGRLNNPPVFTSAPLIMRASGARWRVGTGGGNANLVYNLPVAPYDRSTHYMEGSKALVAPFGIDPATVSWQPEIFLSEEERDSAERRWSAIGRDAGLRLLVNLSTSEQKRRWPDHQFVQTLQFVREQYPGVHIGIIALPAEQSSAERIAAQVGGTTGDVVAFSTPQLRDALALVGTCDLVFTPDTGISHAASAFRKPAVVFMPRNYYPYAPYNTPGELVFWPTASIDSLEVEHVTPALNRLFAEWGRER